MILSAFALATLLSGPVSKLESARGLTVTAEGIPVIQGSGFEYYAPGWTKGYYSSRYNQQTVKKLADGSIQLTFKSDDELASGTQTFRQEGSKLTIDYVFNWSGPSAAKVEVTLGNIWAPVFEKGKVSSDTTTASLDPRTFKSKSDGEERKFTPNSLNFRLDSRLGKVAILADRPLTLFDARDYEWASGDNQFWLGAQDLDVSAGHPATLHCEYQVDIQTPTLRGVQTRSLTARSAPDLIAPNEDLPVLIPKPRFAEIQFDNPIEISDGLQLVADVPASLQIATALGRRFQLPQHRQAPKKVFWSTSETLPKDGYQLKIAPSGISIRAGGNEGRESAIARLVSIAFAKNGRLWLPTGRINDQPSIAWRGVHLFVGPTATDFHRKLWDRFLKPLGFNNVVLQCERTSWETLPGIDTSITMKRADLVRLFEYYRSIGVDPIPLVQSFGHMEWLFANGKNHDLALNPDVLYSVDPRKPRTREVLTALWNEIITNLKPKTVHFGLDEVDMRGWKPNPQFVTEMWNLHIPFLAEIAERKRVRMMLWGDKGLAPSEAVDAGFGDSLVEAEKRRRVIPKNALIGDWHYAGNPDSRKFETSLRVWQASGQKPIASAWFNSQNIQSFFQAAKDTQSAGALITTWAGYESSEETMLAALKQYSAMVMAADYAWNPRPDPIAKLPYDPMQVLKRMYFDEPSSLKSTPGIKFSEPNAARRRIGGVNFQVLPAPIRSASVLSVDAATSPAELSIQLTGRGSKLYLALSTDQPVEDGKRLARVEIGIEGEKPVVYTLKYGLHVRASNAPGVCVFADRTDGISALGLAIPKGKSITYCRITEIDRLAGLTVHGVSLAR